MFRNPQVIDMVTLYDLKGKVFGISGFKNMKAKE